ncbi:aminodeoxychorismate synthase component I [Thalassomonas actiniarum]|uniref:aminodeoxychorismate synthase n=1 Tax=Thalassomonas actiniarum TaxID=485447 RepID=A0AAF0C6K6_9GAMM|nr:aminodeoxychorismate synthase component I [Thalassomonas actiniarum]
MTTKVLALNDNITPLAFFTPLSHQPWAIWLDSCDTGHIDSRYDIFVWQPVVTLETFADITKIHDRETEQHQQSTEDPLSLVKKLQTQVFKGSSLEINELPFNGGAMGYFSYDLGRRFENLPQSAEQDITLPEMAVGIYQQAVIFDNKSRRYFLMCPEHKRLEIEQQLQDGLSNKAPLSAASFSLSSNWRSNMSRAGYGEKFNRVQDYLRSGDCYQINLAQRFSAHYQGDEFAAYRALRQKNQAPFSAFMRFENSVVLSISPERFIRLEQGKVQSKPIKGTRPRSADPQKDKINATALKSASKDRAENLMIVDLLRNDISKTCLPGSVKVPKLFDIESFPAVHHLVSTVEGEIAPGFDGTDLLRGAFPGGSITGAPKIRAMEIIEELEPHRRSVYCGSIGYLSACGNMDTSITIRTLVCQEKTIHCWAGGGVVADSKVDCEYQETFDKVEKILPVLSELT